MTGRASVDRSVTVTRVIRQHRRGTLVAAVAVLTLALVACSSSQAEKAGKNEQPRPLTYEAVDAVTGEPVSLTDLRGRPALLASWATWCAPCRKELPRLEQLHKAQGDDGLQVVVVNLDSPGKDSATIQEIAAGYGLTMRQWRDSEDTFTVAFKGFGIPMSVLLDHRGVVVHRWYGAINPADEDVKGPIAAALAKARKD